ncbi:MAG: hypothetical protein HND52_20740 [Ignavibacteriae bacterium]|nr:hypothetical protein [Ignavibacteriota bacterium]
MEYRRKKGSEMWHFCKNCPNWPFEDFDVRLTKPDDEKIDPECLSRENSNKCKKQKLK